MENLTGNHGLLAAQILLTREDFNQHARSQKVKETIDTLLQHGVVPVVNENDSVSDEELKFGDNDVLSALLASLSHAELLIILTTAKGLMTTASSGVLIPFVSEITPEIERWLKAQKVPLRWGVWPQKLRPQKWLQNLDVQYLLEVARTLAAYKKSFKEMPKEHSLPQQVYRLIKEKWLAFFPVPKVPWKLIMELVRPFLRMVPAFWQGCDSGEWYIWASRGCLHIKSRG